MTRTLNLEFDEHQWGEIANALYEKAGDIAASEAKRTGGYGYSSGGKQGAVERLHGIRTQIIEQLTEMRKAPEVIK